jgi:hypothetical protein
VDQNNPCHTDNKLDYFFYETNYTTEDGSQSDRIDQYKYVVGDSTKHAAVFKIKPVRAGM